MLPIDNTRRPPNRPRVELMPVLGDTEGSTIQAWETDMRATLSKQKGKIAHKDILPHEFSVLPREEKLATT
ncbi:hypothetical protein Kim5_CH02495 [Rhizobium sp. Kim5]|nr:hypothetical protein Kim5_CH02495 [Rhizobium sp. Kim5]